MIALVIFGFLLQAGVLVFAAICQYRLKLRKNDASPVAYGFPVFITGAVALGLGVFGGAWAVEPSTKEVIWEPAKNGGPKSVIWLQQGGQTVGDQRFEPWARRSGSLDNTITTSHKLIKTSDASEETGTLEEVAGTWNAIMGTPRKMKGRTTLVNTSIMFALIGFILQFFGLRVMHSSVTLAQLGAILIMTLVRSFGHITREDHNDIINPEQVEGYELDWLVKDLKKCETWEVITGPMEPVDATSAEITPNAAMGVMKARARLARLSGDWELGIRTKVQILHDCIEATMDEVFTNMSLTAGLKTSLHSSGRYRSRPSLMVKLCNLGKPCNRRNQSHPWGS